MAEIPTAPEAARALADALERAGIPYAVGGAIAYGLHAPPRATNDVDLNVFVDVEDLDRVFSALAQGGATVDQADARISAEDRGDFTVRYGRMRIDVFIPSVPVMDSAAFRVREAVLLGRPIKVLSAEDLALFKLLFFRGKDIVDVERLVVFQGKALDRDYVRGWLVEMVGEGDERVRMWDEFVQHADELGR